MIIQEYLVKLDLLQKEEIDLERFDNALEQIIAKTSSTKTKNYFTLDSLFQKSASKGIAINSEIIKQFSNHSGLLFLEEEGGGNVCYAESTELRSEYKQSFILIDVLDYIYAFVHSSIYKETQKIILPIDADVFWDLVKIGSNIRKTEK
ncbi:hypothetical protein RB619_01195 [Flavobacterium sp. LHD-80]|uniref:hypothetical protein n=1 Tax=Flavobacterium sp. LHD-80 TaxID=3071411 RepID=UPI0027E1A47F|nr:hypothetical protein [Flavobacterium sp. LHD-80]MDQ6469238.1 hypothetical protein [Flavobacterium sp. LHD-80]